MTAQPSKNSPIVLSIGGGKGGVGKSMVSSNLAVQYAQAGLQVVLIDLDVGAANLHTIFGLRNPPKGLADYFNTPRSNLIDYAIDTKIPNLRLIPGSGFVPELANLKHLQKIKILNQVKDLDADLILLDLGAGSSLNVIDFFSMTNAGIVVTTPEPTAIVNAYEFLKNVVYRILFRVFKSHDDILEILKQSSQTIEELIGKVQKKNPWAAETIHDICADLDFHLVFNQARKPTDVHLGVKLHEIAQKYLCISLNFPGMIYHNEEVTASVYKMSPISVVYPESITSQTIHRLSRVILHHVSDRIINGKLPPGFEQQLSQTTWHSQNDFTQNTITKRRLQRGADFTTELTEIAEKG